MARSAQKRRAKRSPPQPARRPRKPERPAYEQQMFFPRLIRQAKWAFVFLALVFAIGFVVFGVGGNLPGTGFGDILQGRIGQTSGPSVGDAREKLEKNPNSVSARKELAEAYEADGKREQAIAAYRDYLQLRPKDTDALRRLAGLHLTIANEQRDEYERLYAEYQERTGGGLFGPAPGSPLGQALGGRIDREFETIYQRRLAEVGGKMQAAYGQAAASYARVASTHPEDEALLQLQIGDASLYANQNQAALNAYMRFLKIAPDDPNASYAKQRIAALRAGAGQPG